VFSYVGDHLLQEFNTMYLTRFRTYKFARPPQRGEERGPQTSQYFLDNNVWHCFLSFDHSNILINPTLISVTAHKEKYIVLATQ
jgi:hypothetical protein